MSAVAYAPPKLDPKDLEAVRARRLVLKDILNTNLLAPAARADFERQYAQTGEILERAAKAAS